jgi:hypothetical protein
MIARKQKIQVIFIGKPQWEAGWPYLGYDNTIIIKEIQDSLISSFKDAEFAWNELISTYDEKLINKIKSDVSISDGIIIFSIGHYGDPGIVQAGIELLESKKPSILANYLYGGDHTFTKILASIKDKKLPVYPISSGRVDDFNKPIKILINLLHIKGKKVLVYASDSIKMNWDVILGLFNPERKNITKEHPEFLEQVGKMSGNRDFEFFTDTQGADQAHQWRKNELLYKTNLKNIFDVEMIRDEPREILAYYNEIDEADAKMIAEHWMMNAIKIEPSKKTILNSARLYLAFKKLLMDKKVDIFTPDCGTFLLTGILPAYPCLAFFELSNEGIYGICESDMDSTISFLFGLYLTGRPGFVSNHTLDTIKDEITYMHCVAPNRLYGIKGEPSPYEILYHGETHLLGASPCVKFPAGEIVTTIKVSVYEKKLSIRRGVIIGNVEDKKGCVSKMLVKSNVQKIMKNYDWNAFGWHRVSFIGDWREDFIIGARLLGLEVIDDDS